MSRILSRIKNNFLKLKNNHLHDSFVIESHLTVRERIKLYELAINKKNIVEIGSFIGASACCFGSAAKKSNSRIYCIDTWENHAMSEGKRNTLEEFNKNTIGYKNYITKIKGYSHDVVNEIENNLKKINLLFIDGDHSYDGVKSDWENYRKFLEKGSIIVLHDFGWAEGVKKVIKEDIKPMVESHGNLPNLWWGKL